MHFGCRGNREDGHSFGALCPLYLWKYCCSHVMRAPTSVVPSWHTSASPLSSIIHHKCQEHPHPIMQYEKAHAISRSSKLTATTLPGNTGSFVFPKNMLWSVMWFRVMYFRVRWCAIEWGAGGRGARGAAAAACSSRAPPRKAYGHGRAATERRRRRSDGERYDWTLREVS